MLAVDKLKLEYPVAFVAGFIKLKYVGVVIGVNVQAHVVGVVWLFVRMFAYDVARNGVPEFVSVALRQADNVIKELCTGKGCLPEVPVVRFLPRGFYVARDFKFARIVADHIRATEVCFPAFEDWVEVEEHNVIVLNDAIGRVSDKRLKGVDAGTHDFLMPVLGNAEFIVGDLHNLAAELTFGFAGGNQAAGIYGMEKLLCFLFCGDEFLPGFFSTFFGAQVQKQMAQAFRPKNRVVGLGSKFAFGSQDIGSESGNLKISL